MDREMREEYLVVIQAKDMGGHMGGLSGTTTVTVTLTDINDNPPKFSKSEWPQHLNYPEWTNTEKHLYCLFLNTSLIGHNGLFNSSHFGITS